MTNDESSQKIMIANPPKKSVRKNTKSPKIGSKETIENWKNPEMNSRILSAGTKVPIRLEINRTLSLSKNGKLTRLTSDNDPIDDLGCG